MAVRYDGRDRTLPGLVEWLQGELTLTPVCPEVGAGLGVPRPPVQLVLIEAGQPPRARGRDDPDLDVTDALRSHAARSLRRLRRDLPLCGCLWKSRSPSCGLDSTPLFDQGGRQIGYTSGIQAQRFRQRLPWLAHCEDTALTSAQDAQRFIWQCRLVFDVMYAGRTALPALHRHYGFLLDLLSEDDRRALGQLAVGQRRRRYLATLHDASRNVATEELLEPFR